MSFRLFDKHLFLVCIFLNSISPAAEILSVQMSLVLRIELMSLTMSSGKLTFVIPHSTGYSTREICSSVLYTCVLQYLNIHIIPYAVPDDAITAMRI